jgi:hypothetical protein
MGDWTVQCGTGIRFEWDPPARGASPERLPV